MGEKLRTSAKVVSHAYKFLENDEPVKDSDLYDYEPELVHDLRLAHRWAPVIKAVGEWKKARATPEGDGTHTIFNYHKACDALSAAFDAAQEPDPDTEHHGQPDGPEDDWRKGR